MDFPDFPEEISASPVSFNFEDVSFELPEQARLIHWLQSIAETEEKPFVEVNFIFCSDEYLRQINVEYLDHDYYTDVITFPYHPDMVHGDVFISSDRVRENASQVGAHFLEELCRVMAHGVLHLAGYDDKTQPKKQAMTAREDYYLQTCPLFPAKGDQ